MKKNNKGFTLIELLAVIVILAIILIIAIPAIGNIIKNSKENAYQDEVKLLERAAKLYVSKDPNILPKTVGGTAEVTIQTLVDNNLLDSIPKDPRTGELLDSNSIVTITRTGDNKYTYQYGAKEVAATLLSKFLSNVGSEGTYTLKNEDTSNEAYFFVGANPNNWIQFGKDSSNNDLMWRIIKNNDEGIQIIYEGVKNGTSAPTADGRVTIEGGLFTYWNDYLPEELKFNVNKWEGSLLEARLATWYDSLNINSTYINPINWCIGATTNSAYTPQTLSNYLTTECVNGTYSGGTFLGKTVDAVGYGLIRASDYISTSSATTCATTPNNSTDCGKLADGTVTNFLYKENYPWWTSIAYAYYRTEVWYIDMSGYIFMFDASQNTNAGSARPVLNLKLNILYVNGAGTLTNPYVVE